MVEEEGEYGEYAAREESVLTMRDYLNIGSVPCDEPCQQVGTDGYNPQLARGECQVFCRQLERLWPAGSFRVKGFDHDFGWYYEVVAEYEAERGSQESERGSQESEALEHQAAFEAEANMPEHWDEEAQADLARLKETSTHESE